MWKTMQMHRKLLVELGIIIVTLTVLFGPSLIASARTAADPFWFSDDVRQQIWPFMRYHDSSLFRGDYVAEYFLDNMPAGYKLLYRSWSMLWDPRVLSKLLPFLLLPVFLTSVAVTARILGGSVAAWGAVALCLSSPYFMGIMSGGLPRAFGIPLVAAGATALALGRPMVLAGVVCLGAMFYPVAAFVLGLTLAAYVLVLPASDRGMAEGWTLRRRFAVVCITAVVSFVMLVPVIRGSAAYGPQIRPGQIAQFPEAGQGGRYARRDSPPYTGFVTEAYFLIRGTLVGRGKPWPEITSWIRSKVEVDNSKVHMLLITVVGLGITGGMVLARRDPAMRRLLLLLLAAILAHGAAITFAPSLYVPSRYVDYPVPVLTVILVPVGACSLGGLLGEKLKRFWLRPAVGLLVSILSLLGLGSRGDTMGGLNVRVDPTQKIYSFLCSLPKDVMVAGWPRGLMENVSYLCSRRVLITHETHHAFHQQYLMEMRRRFTALVNAYYATETTALFRLRNQFGVTHLVLDRRFYSMPRAYFEPYNSHILAAFKEFQKVKLEASSQYPRAVVFDEGPIEVLDLRRLNPMQKRDATP